MYKHMEHLLSSTEQNHTLQVSKNNYNIIIRKGREGMHKKGERQDQDVQHTS